MSRYKPLLLVRTKLGPIELDHLALTAESAGSLRSVLFALTHWPGCFGSDPRLRELHLLHAHFGPDGVCALPLARSLGIPLIVTFHGFDCTVRHRSLLGTGKLSDLQFLAGEGALKRQGALFLAVSAFIRRRLLGLGYPAAKVVRHYLGVDTDLFQPGKGKSDEPYILCVGRHVAKKGINVLLRAFAILARKHQTLSLLQVGAGPLTAELRSLAEALGIGSKVRFLGALGQIRIVELMQGARIFALPSQQAKNGDSEALGLAFNEASACGLPVVATRHGGIPEAVLNGETGFLVEERDELALSERLEQLLSDVPLAERMGRRGREYVREKFDLRRQTSALELLYDGVLQR